MIEIKLMFKMFQTFQEFLFLKTIAPEDEMSLEFQVFRFPGFIACLCNLGVSYQRLQ